MRSIRGKHGSITGFELKTFSSYPCRAISGQRNGFGLPATTLLAYLNAAIILVNGQAQSASTSRRSFLMNALRLLGIYTF